VYLQSFRKFTYIFVHQFGIYFGKHTAHTIITLIHLSANRSKYWTAYDAIFVSVEIERPQLQSNSSDMSPFQLFFS